jgi:hypothetical protein
MPRPNWSRPLPQPLVIPKVMTLKTLADVRELMRHLPASHRERSAWRYVARVANVTNRGMVARGIGRASIPMRYRQISYSIDQNSAGKYRWVAHANVDVGMKRSRFGTANTRNGAVAAVEAAIDQTLDKNSN